MNWNWWPLVWRSTYRWAYENWKRAGAIADERGKEINTQSEQIVRQLATIAEQEEQIEAWKKAAGELKAEAIRMAEEAKRCILNRNTAEEATKQAQQKIAELHCKLNDAEAQNEIERDGYRTAKSDLENSKQELREALEESRRVNDELLTSQSTLHKEQLAELEGKNGDLLTQAADAIKSRDWYANQYQKGLEERDELAALRDRFMAERDEAYSMLRQMRTILQGPDSIGRFVKPQEPKEPT